MKYKMDRLKKLIQKEIMKLIAEHTLKDPRIPSLMTITKISLSKDMHYCHIYFSMIDQNLNRSQALIGLNSAKGFIQKVLADNLNMRYTPKIEFRYDADEEKAYKVDNIINNLINQRKEEKTSN